MWIGYHRSHEASVVAIDDAGRPLHAISEERLSRVKMQGGWPKLAAAWLGERVRFLHGTLVRILGPGHRSRLRGDGFGAGAPALGS